MNGERGPLLPFRDRANPCLAVSIMVSRKWSIFTKWLTKKGPAVAIYAKRRFCHYRILIPAPPNRTYFNKQFNIMQKHIVTVFLTWTRLSGKLIFSATSSRMKMSGYRVFVNKFSKMSSCALVNVVRSRRCFRVGIPKIELVEKKWETICQRLFQNLVDLLRGAKIFIILFVATFPLWATTLH